MPRGSLRHNDDACIDPRLPGVVEIEVRAIASLAKQDDNHVATFVRLTAPHQRELLGLARALCRDPDQAADLAQETLIHAFNAFDRFRPDAPVRPWLRRILRNLFLDSLKTGRARHEVRADGGLGEDDPSPPDVAVDPADPLAALERAELAGWLREEIQALDPDRRQVVELCVIHELSFQEIAELTGVPVGTVASRLARGRATLRERMLARAQPRGPCQGGEVSEPGRDGVAARARMVGDKGESTVRSGSEVPP